MRRLVVGAVIVDSLTAPTCVWVARRTTPPDLAGRWEFPGGKVEPGETPQAALHRELCEELGVEVTVGAEVAHPGGAWPISETHELRLFLVTTTTDPRPGDSHDRVRRLHPGELDDLDLLPADAAAVPALRRLLATTDRGDWRS